MKDYGFIRVATATPIVRLADTDGNTKEIISQIAEAEEKGVSLVVFPELCMTGYTCGDLFTQRILLERVEENVKLIAETTEDKNVAVVVGAPVLYRTLLYNCAIVIRDGEVKGIVPKIHLPNTSEFYEARWFTPGSDIALGSFIEYAGFECPISSSLLFRLGDATLGIELCEDLWTPIPPSTYHCICGADIIANLSASNELGHKGDTRKVLTRQQSTRCHCAYVYSCCGWGESTQDAVFAGAAMIYEDGTQLAAGERFTTKSTLLIADVDLDKLVSSRLHSSTFKSISPDGVHTESYKPLYTTIDLGDASETDFDTKLYRDIDDSPFLPKVDEENSLSEIVKIQTAGLAGRLAHIKSKSAVVGISGGLDSTLAVLITALAFDKLGLDRKGITGVTMPGYGTTARTKSNAVKLMEVLGLTVREISIAAACDQHFKDIDHDKSVHDVTFENAQARERTQILMDIANQTNGIVVGTGDLSELALGWCTYNGDHMSMYGVNAGIPKTLVRKLCQYLAGSSELESESREAIKAVVDDIVNTPISPELIPADGKGNIVQVTEDLVGPYELHDFFLFNFLSYGYSPSKIQFLAEKAFKGTYDAETISKWLKTFVRRFFNQQFKRSCMPDGPKVTPVSLSPRGDWRMPSDALSATWLNDIN